MHDGACALELVLFDTLAFAVERRVACTDLAKLRTSNCDDSHLLLKLVALSTLNPKIKIF